MNGAFYVGAAGLRAQQRALDITANNIANMNTPAFKRSEVRFSELVARRTEGVDGQTVTTDPSVGLLGVRADTASRVFAQGDLRQTGKPMDIAIDGDGFIELLGQDNQTLLWRGGTLKINSDGYLAAANGMTLKAMISAPAGTEAIAIGRDGKIQAQVAGETGAVDLGRLDLVLSRDLSSLQAEGEGLFKAASDADLSTVAAGEDGGGVLVQGSIETSNVQLSDEMVTLLLMQRAYGASAQVVQAGDQLMSIINGLKR